MKKKLKKLISDIGVAEVCGKCLVDLPYSFENPAK